MEKLASTDKCPEGFKREAAEVGLDGVVVVVKVELVIVVMVVWQLRSQWL